MYLHYAKGCFSDHQSRYIINSKETAPEALDYLEKEAVDAQVSQHTHCYSHKDQEWYLKDRGIHQVMLLC